MPVPLSASLAERHTPKVFTIEVGVSFADALVEGLLAQFGDDPQNLARVILLLPTRRACRTVREAFLRKSDGAAMLLPRMSPIGDLDEDELSIMAFAGNLGEEVFDILPAISPLRRQLLLGRLVMARQGGGISTDQAVQLAGDLAKLLDQIHTEGLDFADLKHLVPEEFAEHWQITLDFLNILTEAWPTILAAEQALDPAQRRNLILAAQKRLWQESPPDFPVIAAGSTGSIPAVADLLTLIAGLPSGQVILPGVERGIDEETWHHVDPSHPQWGLKSLLMRFRMTPNEVALWPSSKREAFKTARAQVLSEAMLPAKLTARWREFSPPQAWALDNVLRLDCPSPKEEAGVIALILREVLETEGKTAALVTPDRNLARRVASELRRWGVEIDDSAGVPLDQTPPAGFMRLVAEVALSDFAPVDFLAMAKHPLAAGAMAPSIFRSKVRRLELGLLRGPRPGKGLAGMRHAFAQRCDGENPPSAVWREDVDSLLGVLETAFAPLMDVLAKDRVPLAEILNAHIQTCENLATSDELDGAQRLWADEAGEALANFCAELLESADVLAEVKVADYPRLFTIMLSGRAVRPRYGAHPRLSVLGLFEARLHQADLVVLAGLNEGTWPPEIKASPWMSRPMMKAFGLPQPETAIGQAAHDFIQNFGANEVVITRSLRVEGTPTVPSRWLLRLENRLRNTDLAHKMINPSNWFFWRRKLDDPGHRPKPWSAPAPKPPVSVRPRKLFVTQIEAWMRDPYAIYARHILGVKALEPIDADPGAAQYGTIIHEALERFTKEVPGRLGADAKDQLLAIGREVFGSDIDNPGVWAFWWPRFERIAEWFIDQERQRRPKIAKTWTEIEGSMKIEAVGGLFEVAAKADRLDKFEDARLAIIDYKTGAPPSAREVEAGYAPQLPLEAAIAQAGGFAEIGPLEVEELEFWRLRGGGDGAGERKSAGKDIQTLISEALDGVKGLINAFDRPETPYEARPNPEAAPKYSDYEHLARVREWSSGDSEGEN